MWSKQTKQELLEGRGSKSILKKDKGTATSLMAAGRGKGSGPCYHQLIKQEVQACTRCCRNICHGNQMRYSDVWANKSCGKPDEEWWGRLTPKCGMQGAKGAAGLWNPWCLANGGGVFLKYRWESGVGGGWLSKFITPHVCVWWAAKVRATAGRTGKGYQLMEDKPASDELGIPCTWHSGSAKWLWKTQRFP